MILFLTYFFYTTSGFGDLKAWRRHLLCSITWLSKLLPDAASYNYKKCGFNKDYIVYNLVKQLIIVGIKTLVI
jgi:hypothetical protein